eukprot:jgi/Botrbrau1/16383/Bobra.85_2s0007.1
MAVHVPRPWVSCDGGLASKEGCSPRDHDRSSSRKGSWEHMKIPKSDLEIFRGIREGYNSEVFLGRWQHTDVAVRVLQCRQADDGQSPVWEQKVIPSPSDHGDKSTTSKGQHAWFLDEACRKTSIFMQKPGLPTKTPLSQALLFFVRFFSPLCSHWISCLTCSPVIPPPPPPQLQNVNADASPLILEEIL